MGGIDVDHIERLFIPEKGGAVGGPRLLLEKTQVVFLFRHGSRRTPTGFIFPFTMFFAPTALLSRRTRG